MSHFEPTADQSKWQHDQLTRHIATSIQIENGQLTGYHQNGSYINGNGLFRPTEITSEFDTVEKKPEISWNPEKVWAAENGLLTKLSPSDQGIVRSATPSANSTESAPSSVRHSIGPEESESTEDPESKSSRTETPEEKPNIERLQNATEEASNLLMNFKRSEDNGTNHLDIEKNLLLAMQMEKQLLREKIIDNSSTNLSSSTAESITNVVNAVATADFEIDYQPQPTLPPKTQSPANPPRSRGYCRPPGLGGPSEPTQNGNGKVFICSICSFSCPSKFHYNSHMNTHGDHRCSMCDYTARTEGRMRKHMKDSHTREEQLAVGLDFSNDSSKSPQKSSTTITSSMASDISSTMNSIMEMANRVANGSAENGGLGAGFPSALESIKAFAEGGSEGLANFLLPRPPSENGFESAGPSNGRDPPRRSSGGKPKKYPCKQCPHISTTKDEVWSHMKSHIPVEKQLCCPQCDFVTEYKHHLEYHTRNHFSMRPFKCNKCNYSCVNKSMLNSHMKSHSNQYQFQCQDCNYQSKYCHSLKMHLRKYSHNRKPGVTMDVDDAEEAMLNDPSLEDPGSVASSNHENQMNTPTTPVTTSSVTTLSSTFGSSLLQPLPSTSTVQYANFLRQKQEEMNETLRNRQMLNCTVCDHTCQTVDQMLQHNLIHLQQNPQPPTNFNAIFQYLSNNMNGLVPPTISTSGTSTLNLGNTISSLGFNPSELLLQVQKEQEKESSPIELETIKQEIERTPTPGPSSNEDSPLSAERSSTSPIDPNRETSSTGSANSSPRKRKCKPSEKLDEISQRLQIKNSPEHNYETTTIPQPIPISAFRQPFLDRAPILPSYINNCSHCRISFDDVALFNIHRGYHGFDNPFKCNRCGEIFDSSMEFNLHLWREKHD